MKSVEIHSFRLRIHVMLPSVKDGFRETEPLRSIGKR